MTQDKETLREAVARAMRLSAPELALGDAWAHVSVKQSQMMADAAIATMFERLRTPSLRCEPANGATLKEMRENLSTELKDAGDCRLVWVNEGDLAMLTAFQQENGDGR